jgi:hypothetical protein
MPYLGPIENSRFAERGTSEMLSPEPFASLPAIPLLERPSMIRTHSIAMDVPRQPLVLDELKYGGLFLFPRFSVMGFSLFLKKFVDDEEAVSQHVKHR